MVYSILFCDIKKDLCECMPESTYVLHAKSYVLIESRCVTWRARDVAYVFALVLNTVDPLLTDTLPTTFDQGLKKH